ncbi:hypothetical protein R6V09_22850 [Streptomyces sp. W16]|uniref:hypothetical protein n=1 Tax=Streptomyces sp. W16 TaxID=3076631 RepID=UPI00295AE046|nr:hypothetical protein [Streptomyces sp. W16]MDV9172941.1 hypothetical protein [Streptomyces sp. W16]
METGSVLDGTYGWTTLIAAGVYRGAVILTPAVEHLESFAGATFHLRQGVYVGADGVVTENSVLSSVRGGRLTDAYAKNVALTSTGEAFNGSFVADGASYALKEPGSPSTATAAWTSRVTVPPSPAREPAPGWSWTARASTTGAWCAPGSSPATAPT